MRYLTTSLEAGSVLDRDFSGQSGNLHSRIVSARLQSSPATNPRLATWLNLAQKSDDDEDDGLSHQERIKKVHGLMRKGKALYNAIDQHRLEAMKAIKAACPGIADDEMNKFINRIRAKGRAKIIDIDKIRAKARARIGARSKID
jgi:hypothetical protein